MKRLSALGSRLSASMAVLILAAGCARARIDPQLSTEPRLEATIEVLGDEVARLRLQLDSLSTSSDSLRVELARLQLELQRIKDIDLRRRPARPRP